MAHRTTRCTLAALLVSGLSLAAQTAPTQTAPAKTTPTNTATHPAKPATHPATHHPATAPGVTPLPKGVPPVKAPMKVQYVVRYQDITIGQGDLAQPNQVYKVHYTGWLASDGTKFDSSYDRGTPIEFMQGSKRVITGWDQGFEGMHVGGKRRLFIPYELAYGEKGRGPIPPKAELIFDVELIEQRDPGVPGLDMHPAPQQQQPDRAEPKPQSPQ